MKDIIKQINLKKPKSSKSFYAECKNKLVFAFDFGEYATKVAVGKLSKDKFQIRNLLVIENDERGTKLDKTSVKEWRAKISKSFTQNNLNPSGQIALVTVNSRKYISRQLEIPLADEKDQVGLVAHEMSQLLSLDVDSYVFQHKIKKTYENHGVQMCTVWAAAMQKDDCDAYYELLEALKLKPLIMDTNINGIERMFQIERGIFTKLQDKTVAVVDYGFRSTEVNIFQNGEYLQGSNISLGESQLVSAAKNTLGVQISDIHNGNKLIVSPQTIYDIIRQANDSDQSQIFMTVVEEWLTEINAVINRYNINHPNDPVSYLLAYGGSLQFPWLKAYLERYLGVGTSVISSIDASLLQDKIEMPGNTIPQFVNALSLFFIQ